jgi:hypothetical protein
VRPLNEPVQFGQLPEALEEGAALVRDNVAERGRWASWARAASAAAFTDSGQRPASALRAPVIEAAVLSAIAAQAKARRSKLPAGASAAAWGATPAFRRGHGPAELLGIRVLPELPGVAAVRACEPIGGQPERALVVVNECATELHAGRAVRAAEPSSREGGDRWLVLRRAGIGNPAGGLSCGLAGEPSGQLVCIGDRLAQVID